MQPAWTESDRLAALRGYRVLDTPPEPVFDDLVQLAARACQAPVALITLIDERRQWFKAEVGLGVRETPLDRSICLSAMVQPGLTIVPDLTEDPRFAHNPLVKREPHLRFYAGAVLRTPDGIPLGALCVFDRRPRDLPEEQASTLTMLAAQVMSQLELRRAVAERDEKLETSHHIEQRQSLLVRELHHRVKNTLATVQALAYQTFRSSMPPEIARERFEARLLSLSRTHNLLNERNWTGAALKDVLALELEPFIGEHRHCFTATGPDIDLPARMAVVVGMIFHELATNAAKYGALSIPFGRVVVAWHVVMAEGQRVLQVEWTERGGPSVEEPLHRGFGPRLIEQATRQQLNGSALVSFAAEGLTCRLDLPLDDNFQDLQSAA